MKNANVYTKAARVALTAALLTASLAHAESVFRIARDAASLASVNLNPFSGGSQRLYPTVSAIYETLFYVNSLTGDVENVLGTAYKWDKSNKKLTVTVRDGVKWSDGQPFTAKDVEFTFDYLKQNPAIDGSALWKNGLTDVKASGNTVTFTFKDKNIPVFVYIAHQPIVPQHIWSKIKDPTTETNTKPVATGPFVFQSANNQSIKVVKNPSYWMKGYPKIDAIQWEVVGGADAILLKLLRGDADYSYANIPDIKNVYVNKNPETNKFYWPVTGGNYLYFNTAKAPFSDVNFRKAIASAINTDEVALKAYSGLVKAASPSGIIPTQQSKWLSKTTAAKGIQFDVNKAKDFLKRGGYKVVNGKLTDKSGKTLPTFKILVGAGWTDFITMAQVIGNNLKQIGIDTTIDQQTWGSYSGGLQTGTYDMGISWGWGGGETPYNLFFQSFAPEFSAKVGDTAASNLTRYTKANITSSLKRFQQNSDPAVQKKAIDTIVNQFVTDVPFFPLTDRVNFTTYNSKNFKGFPTDANPYYDGGADDQIGARLLFLNLEPK